MDAAGKNQEDAGYFDCVCWRQVAEAAADTVVKGMRVQLSGELRQDRWEKADGTRHARIFVLVAGVSLPLRKLSTLSRASVQAASMS